MLKSYKRVERERQVFDPNRCAPGYKLQVSESVDIHRRGQIIGTCNEIKD